MNVKLPHVAEKMIGYFIHQFFYILFVFRQLNVGYLSLLVLSQQRICFIKEDGVMEEWHVASLIIIESHCIDGLVHAIDYLKKLVILFDCFIRNMDCRLIMVFEHGAKGSQVF